MFWTIYKGEYTYLGDIYDLQSGTAQKNVALFKVSLSTNGSGFRTWNTSNNQKLFTNSMITFKRYGSLY